MRKIIPLLLLLSGCSKPGAHRPESPAGGPAFLDPACGSHIHEAEGAIRSGEKAVTIPGFKEERDDLTVYYQTGDPSTLTASLGVNDSTFSYVVNGEVVTMRDRLGVPMTYTVAALIKECS